MQMNLTLKIQGESKKITEFLRKINIDAEEEGLNFVYENAIIFDNKDQFTLEKVKDILKNNRLVSEEVPFDSKMLSVTVKNLNTSYASIVLEYLNWSEEIYLESRKFDYPDEILDSSILDDKNINVCFYDDNSEGYSEGEE